MTIKAVLTDIEGTTSAVSFVFDVLFPYAREHLDTYLDEHGAEPAVSEQLDAVRAEVGEPEASRARVAEILQQWMREDRKAAPLKTLQGMIWADGYRRGELVGHVYDDAVAGLRQWHKQGVALYVYSSGSVQAQKLIFGCSSAGDLTPLFSGYFDTLVGGKREQASYTRIADAIALPAAQILFLSDIAAELDAARAAGFATCGLVREPGQSLDGHPWVTRFSEINLADFTA